MSFDGLLCGVGAAADSALWRDKYLSGGVLGGSTLVWFLLEKSGYTFVTLLCNILMFVVVILFVWSNVAALLHRFLLFTCMMICTYSSMSIRQVIPNFLQQIVRH
jgi:hypothetical protein